MLRILLIAIAVIWGGSLAIVLLAYAGGLVSRRIRRMIDGE